MLMGYNTKVHTQTEETQIREEGAEKKKQAETRRQR
jgi:hypothetical protein